MSSRSSVTAGASRIGALGLLAVALGCAALAAFAIGNTMKSSYSGTKVTSIVVAKAQLRAGQAISADLLEVRAWPEGAVPAGAFNSIEELLVAAKGATPAVGILPGEPVVAGRLSSARTGSGVATLIKPNMRAFALSVDAAVGYTGLLYPGAFVDVVATMRDPMGRGPSARIAVQKARVLSVGLDTDVATRHVARGEDGLDKNAERGTYVTLEVAPADAEILAVARAEGKIDLVLRNASDDALIETPGATPDRFSAFAVPVLPAAPAAAPAAAPPAEPVSRAPTAKLERRSMQIVASDRPDVPAPAPAGGAIEVLNAK